ncbi:MAG: hypothetical protein JNM31_00290 [Flavobacteriales bacterium]|nr:hypothetical protein [Flavobacteriales bacterium]
MHHLFALLNLIGLFLVEALLTSEVKVVQEAPAMMQAGQEMRVTVTVDKGTLTGFAKLQLELPAGLTATAVETKGASFTFADQKAKFIWMSLPSQPKFQISYILRAEPFAAGSYTITGRLSYIEENERRTHELTASTLQVSGGAPLALVPEPTEAETTTGAAATLSPEALNDVVTASGGISTPLPVVILPQRGQGDVKASRSIIPQSSTEMLVEVRIEKGALRGFGKLQETIPAGFTAVERASDEAIFTAQGTIVKFVWLNMPARQELKVTYKLRSTSAPAGSYVINGEFGYLLNDETQRAVVGTTVFNFGQDAVPTPAQQQVAVTPAPPKSEPVVPVIEEPRPKQEPVATQPLTPVKPVEKEPTSTQRTPPTKPAEPVTATKSTSRIPEPETGLVFRVQISAAHREVGREYFTQRHRYTGEFMMERHEGWVKYTTGRHSQYRGARDQRQQLIAAGHEFPGPFVTAYNNGERITVQEALMIGNQRWVQ